ncbi:MAG: dTDP-4-dehydrorhamnose reductase [Terrimicrobiaceae bacterium]|nr:dTDP-4-dehydrorhamnose reductase [Terrimicrobiaceae bacterium]
MARILILGAGGRLAAALAREWSAQHAVETAKRSDVDVSDAEALQRFLETRAFDVLVNGTGMTNVDGCESERELAEAVNARAPQIMAQRASAVGARLIHFSTDYVFAGDEPKELTEDDIPNPLGWYGRTKLDGEQRVLDTDPSHLVVRVSWVFGRDKPAFIDMLIDRARTQDSVAAVADKYSSPTHTADAAGWLEPFFDRSRPGGIYHACNQGGCSWREFGEFALEAAAAVGVPVRTTRVEPIRLADMKQFLAPRPVHTILRTDKLTRTTGLTPRPWTEAVRDYISEKYASISPAA